MRSDIQKGGGTIMMRSLVALAAVVLVCISFSTDLAFAKDGQYDQSLREGEDRPTLDPSQFQNPMIKKAYQAAKDIPWVLDSIYCFCFCKESPAFRHKSLLSCYVDLHAAR
jgi:hypothetical protein